MPSIVGVRFRPSGQVGYFDPVGLELAVGDKVLVETEAGPREGRVTISPDQVAHSGLRGPMLPVLHKIDESSA